MSENRKCIGAGERWGTTIFMVEVLSKRYEKRIGRGIRGGIRGELVMLIGVGEGKMLTTSTSLHPDRGVGGGLGGDARPTRGTR